MNKSEFLDNVAVKANVPRRNAAIVFEAIQDVIVESLKAGDKVTLTGFGTFETRGRAARTGRNPKTGETINIAAKTVPAFKPGNILKEATR